MNAGALLPTGSNNAQRDERGRINRSALNAGERKVADIAWTRANENKAKGAKRVDQIVCHLCPDYKRYNCPKGAGGWIKDAPKLPKRGHGVPLRGTEEDGMGVPFRLHPNPL